MRPVYAARRPARRGSSARAARACQFGVKPSGRSSMASFSSASRSAGTAVSRYLDERRVGLVGVRCRPLPTPPRASCGSPAILVRVSSTSSSALPSSTTPRSLELLGPDLAHRRVLADDLVHHRLGVGRLVALVVAEAAVADQVDHEVLAELLAVRVGHPHGAHARLRVVGVDVHDRHLEPLREVARVRRRARVVPLGREPELVVGDDVDGAAGRVAGQTAEVQGLGHDPLARERRVPVQQDGQRGLRSWRGAPGLVALLLGSAGHALDHRVDVLEVARVGRQVDQDLLVGLLLGSRWKPRMPRWYFTSPTQPSPGLSAAEGLAPVSAAGTRRRSSRTACPGRARAR